MILHWEGSYATTTCPTPDPRACRLHRCASGGRARCDSGGNGDAASQRRLRTARGDHGKARGGCGLYGARGDLEGAYTILRNKAAQLGADYVQVLRITEPRTARQINPCQGEFAGVAVLEPDARTLRGSYVGRDCSGSVTASFTVTRQ